MFDLTKLTPGPFVILPSLEDVGRLVDSVVSKALGSNVTVATGFDHEGHDAAFFIVARKVFDIQIRRGWWSCVWQPGGYVIAPCSADGNKEFYLWLCYEQQGQEDPFTPWILVEEWYCANVERLGA